MVNGVSSVPTGEVAPCPLTSCEIYHVLRIYSAFNVPVFFPEFLFREKSLSCKHRSFSQVLD